MSFTPTLQPAGGAELAGLPAAVAGATQKRWSRQVAVDIVGLLDVAAVVAGAIVPATIYSYTGGLVTNWTSILQSALVTSIIFAWAMRNCNMYDTQLLHDFPSQPSLLLSSLAIAVFSVLGLGLPFAPRDVHMWVWYAAWTSTSFMLLLWIRIMARMVLARLTAAGRFDTRIAVYGAGPVARRVHDHLRSSASGICFAGVFDDRGADRLNTDGLNVDGTLEQLIAAGRDGRIDQIVIALPQAADRRMASIAAKLEQLPVSVHIVTHISSDLVDGAPAHRVSSLGGVGLLDVKAKPLADWAPFLKRAEDKILGTILLVAALPIMALVAIAIKLDSRGPVLFRQRRRGLNHKTFEVMKFRTMSVMEDGPSIMQATTNDPRITRVGALLRRTSLDELPQLFNVLRGDMSLVGPRPHALSHDDHWGETMETYFNRHQVKPGITGLAQVSGFRGEATSTEVIEQRVKHDLAYIRSWSLGLDLKILVRTVSAVLFGKNAY